VAFTIIRHNVLNDQAATQQTQVAGNSLEIGRGSGNALLLDDLHISPRHAVIEYVDGRYVIKDLESRGGTYVNHRAVCMQPLTNGDVVHIGNYNLRMVCQRMRAFSPLISRARAQRKSLRIRAHLLFVTLQTG
jgi:pSer/pThr/pTyr-binding forkhead associated (FHA) protein